MLHVFTCSTVRRSTTGRPCVTPFRGQPWLLAECYHHACTGSLPWSQDHNGIEELNWAFNLLTIQPTLRVTTPRQASKEDSTYAYSYQLLRPGRPKFSLDFLVTTTPQDFAPLSASQPTINSCFAAAVAHHGMCRFNKVTGPQCQSSQKATNQTTNQATAATAAVG